MRSSDQPRKGRKSRAGKSEVLSALKRELLVRVAAELGPSMDQVDVVSPRESVKVRELILELTKADGPSPAEIRGALMDLVEDGHLGWTMAGEELLEPDAKVHVRVRGLLAARKVKPNCGRPTTCVTLRMKPWKRYGVFGAWVDTGVRQREAVINKPGLNLAAFYVLAAWQPTHDEPMRLIDCPWMFARLAHLGVGVKSGPGLRIMPSLAA